MDKYVIRAKDPLDLTCGHQPVLSSAHNKLPTPGSSKKSSLLSSYEIHGRVLPAYKPSLLKLILGSYSVIGSYPQTFFADFFAGRRHYAPSPQHDRYPNRTCISCIDFDSKGIYLASVSNTGCLSVHEYETLYCTSANGEKEGCKPFVRLLSTRDAMEAVRWNPFNQDEVACVAAGSNEVYFFDIACDSVRPSEVLRVKRNAEVVGLNDLLLCKYGSSRVLACGKDGNVHIWDRRAAKLSFAALPASNSAGPLNCMQLSNDEQVVYAGSEGGLIHAWDLRGGRQSAAFVTSGEVYHPPLGAVKLSTILGNIHSLRAQTEVGTSAVHSISLDSSSGHRLAFHLNIGWSGVLDLATLDVTHLHCPPPPWVGCELGWVMNVPVVQRRRPVWLPSHSVYAAASASAAAAKIHMLDFTPGPSSRHSLDGSATGHRNELPQFEIPTGESVVAIAAHPLNDQLVAGTRRGMLLLLGQKKYSSSNREISSSSQEQGFQDPLSHDSSPGVS